MEPKRKEPYFPTISAVFAVALLSLTSTAAENLPGSTVGATPTVCAPNQGLLDGKTFVTQSGEKGCNKYGFENAPYQATAYGSAIRFHAEIRSSTHGEMVRDGIVRGDAFEATNARTRWLPAEFRRTPEMGGMGKGIANWLLYRDTGGTLSLCALVLPPGGVTPVHDHLA